MMLQKKYLKRDSTGPKSLKEKDALIIFKFYTLCQQTHKNDKQ